MRTNIPTVHTMDRVSISDSIAGISTTLVTLLHQFYISFIYIDLTWCITYLECAYREFKVITWSYFSIRREIFVPSVTVNEDLNRCTFDPRCRGDGVRVQSKHLVRIVLVGPRQNYQLSFKYIIEIITQDNRSQESNPSLH